MDDSTVLETSPARTAFEQVMRRAWAIEPEALETILQISQRLGDGPEAVSMRLGRPLRNTRTVELRDGVAIVPIEGPIFPKANLFTAISGATSTEVLAQDIRTALDDPSVNGIVLNVSSPGGAAEGISELARHIFEARSEKRIVAYIAGDAESAAYWLASAAGEVVIADTGLAGSIGVVAGVRVDNDPKRVEIVSSQSPNKRPDVMTDAGRAEVQRVVDSLAQVFVDAVAEFRGVGVDAVLSDFGQGGLLVGEQAVAADMADRTGSLEEIIAGFSGDMRGSSMNANSKVSVSEISREYIAENHPAIAEAFRAEGVDSVDLDRIRSDCAESARAAAYDEGAAAERERLLGIDKVFEGYASAHGALLVALKRDPKATPAAAAMRLLSAENEARGKRIEDIRHDSVHPAPATDSGTDSAPPQDFDALVQDRIDGGSTRANAIRHVARAHPKVHEAYLATQRRGRVA